MHHNVPPQSHNLLLRPKFTDINGELITDRYFTLMLLDDQENASFLYFRPCSISEEYSDGGKRLYNAAGKMATGEQVSCILIYDDKELTQQVQFMPIENVEA